MFTAHNLTSPHSPIFTAASTANQNLEVHAGDPNQKLLTPWPPSDQTVRNTPEESNGKTDLPEDTTHMWTKQTDKPVDITHTKSSSPLCLMLPKSSSDSGSVLLKLSSPPPASQGKTKFAWAA
jgi:hypothetical protein